LTHEHPAGAGAPDALSPAKRRLFLALTLLVPLVLLGTLELVLRVAWRGGAIAAFTAVPAGPGLLTPDPGVARRYFASEARPPAPPTDVFAATKPTRSLRLFVLGESSAAGFPYPHNGTFSRVLADALRDVLPGDSIEVVNVGIAATNSFTLVDLAEDVISQHPDAILIYAGHNEYYGALGVGSSVRVGSSPRFIRLYLAAQRLRTVLLLRNAIAAVRGSFGASPPADSTAATFMESVARDQEIVLGGTAYAAGLAQFAGNMTIVLTQFRDARIPVFIGSIASNERDQRPFASPANGPARATFDSATRALAAGDSSVARRLFAHARDLDVVRFRAPAALDDTIRALATRLGAHYVPVAERMAGASPGGMPGRELFLEHVHPNRRGYALIAEAFFDALRARQFMGHAADLARLAPWPAYERRMELSAFDEATVRHTVRTITTRWPFVSRADAVDYRGTYRPVDFTDSLALLVARGGMTWTEGKLRLAAQREAAGDFEGALAEYRGLLRDKPYLEASQRLVGRTLARLNRVDEARPYLERAMAIQPNAESAYLLGSLALRSQDYPRAIALLDRAVTMAPDKVAPVYELSVAFGKSGNVAAARAAASRAAQLDARHPGLGEWMTALGMRAP
jgi:tetratricopeptide (TPR) repeat protein